MVDTTTDFSLLGNEYIESYYTHPDPHQAIEALEGYLQSPFVTDAVPQVLVGYFYARLAQLHPHLIDEYVSLLLDANSTAETFIQGILADLRKKSSRSYKYSSVLSGRQPTTICCGWSLL
jgi:hypothetical protein